VNFMLDSLVLLLKHLLVVLAHLAQHIVQSSIEVLWEA
jgi:hypothetical protein